jgi:hypothetical protein
VGRWAVVRAGVAAGVGASVLRSSRRGWGSEMDKLVLLG